MRDADDTATAEIPGVEPLPPKPLRQTEALRRAAAGYVDPSESQAPCCRRCEHLTFC